MKIYERNINSAVSRTGPDTITTTASLLDLNHSMSVTLTINLRTRLIEDARAQILKAPLRVCDSTTDLMGGLKGLRVDRGINSELVKRLGGENGCTHLYELALNAVRLSFNVMIGLGFDWGEWVNKTGSDEEFVAKAMPHLEGSCRPFRSGKD